MKNIKQIVVMFLVLALLLLTVKAAGHLPTIHLAVRLQNIFLGT